MLKLYPFLRLLNDQGLLYYLSYAYQLFLNYLLQDPLEQTLPPVAPYHTERMMASMGVKIFTRKVDDSLCYASVLYPPEPLTLHPLQVSLPGDFSAAAFLIVAACIMPGSEIILKGIGLNPTRTGLLEALISMGANIEILRQNEQAGEPIGDLRVRAAPLNSTVVSGELVVRMIDEFPIFAIAAACAKGKTVVRDARELRYKESDRIAELGRELANLGNELVEYPDGFQIAGGKPIRGGKIDPHGDHRLAMSFAVAGLVAEEDVFIGNPAIMDESFPGFVELLQFLAAEVDILGPAR